MVFGTVNNVVLPEHEIALALFHSDLGGGHLGIIFNEKGNELRVVELGWHHAFYVSEIPHRKCGIAIPIALPPKAGKSVIAVVRAVSRKKPKISYGIDFIASKGSFVGTTYTPPKGSDGLTCASFVLEVLRSAAVPLIREETWTDRDANRKWAADVIMLLRQHGADDKHVAAVEKNVNGLRLIPFELAAAASLPIEKRPASYTDVQETAEELRGQLNTACPAPPNQPVGMVLRAG
ncbi:hypothetical protein [Pseudomonas extremaustralis]|uniref:Uncharacterized protein n=1 Tax=Pseudomonas extremaustralis TaxID=359110 RepID=A0A5C5Q8A5_9PSED|nr:hypothetical protein [Pseudomonas extremaustralis]TWS01834.1 hypothetical protein FIV36_22900 [Pseudomonas extremaustralis]SDF94519.1 hypothetical protein SAMN05216591_4462 [Pseudomonas extremaustralis]